MSICLSHQIPFNDPSAGLLPLPNPESPPTVTGFVGRTTELKRYLPPLKKLGATIITGMPGVGKTALATTIVKSLDLAPKQVFWHSFQPGDGIEDLNWKLAAFLAWNDDASIWQALHEPPSPPVSVLFSAILQVLETRRRLLCFDDFHHVQHDETFAHYVRTLSASTLPLLVVSRRAVNLAPNRSLRGLKADSARQLLEREGVELNDEDFDTLQDTLQGNVQLLLLAADLLKEGREVHDVIQPWQNNRTARYLLCEVYHRLSEEERALMQLVSVLQSYPATRTAIDGILETGSQAEILVALVDRRLLTGRDTTEGRTYKQHAMIQAFFYDQMSEQERLGLHRRVGAYFSRESEPVRAMDKATELRDRPIASLALGSQYILQAALHYERAGDLLNATRVLATCPPAILFNQGRLWVTHDLLARLLESPLVADLAQEEKVGLERLLEHAEGVLR